MNKLLRGKFIDSFGCNCHEEIELYLAPSVGFEEWAIDVWHKHNFMGRTWLGDPFLTANRIIDETNANLKRCRTAYPGFETCGWIMT